MSAVTRIAKVRRRRIPKLGFKCPVFPATGEELHEQIPRVETEELPHVVAEPRRALEREERLRKRPLARQEVTGAEAARQRVNLVKNGASRVEPERQRNGGHPRRDH